MIYSSRSIFCNSSWFVNDWNQTVFKCSIQKFRNFFIFIFVVVKKVKVEIPCGTEKFIGLQGNGIYIFQKMLKALKSPSGGLKVVDRMVLFGFLDINSIHRDS